MRVTVEFLCPHNKPGWHYTGPLWGQYDRGGTCTRGSRKVFWV